MRHPLRSKLWLATLLTAVLVVATAPLCGCASSGSNAKGVGLDISVLDVFTLNLGVEEFEIERPPESEDFEVRWSPVVHPKPAEEPEPAPPTD